MTQQPIDSGDVRHLLDHKQVLKRQVEELQSERARL